MIVAGESPVTTTTGRMAWVTPVHPWRLYDVAHLDLYRLAERSPLPILTALPLPGQLVGHVVGRGRGQVGLPRPSCRQRHESSAGSDDELAPVQGSLLSASRPSSAARSYSS